MFRDEKLELKVGLFVGIGIFMMFLIVFSIGDFYLLKKGYSIRVIFDYVNGITENAPVRLAGVYVGEIRDMGIYYDEDAGRNRVWLDAWIEGDLLIERDAVARINTLGLLGEQYLEISPGTEKDFLAPGDALLGKNPVDVGLQMDRMGQFVDSTTEIMQRVQKGEGTLGKLLVDDTLYDDLKTIFGRLTRGEGTIGKLLVEDKIYYDLEDFVSDIKAHPWKLLHKPSGGRKKPGEEKKRGTVIEPR